MSDARLRLSFTMQDWNPEAVALLWGGEFPEPRIPELESPELWPEEITSFHGPESCKNYDRHCLSHNRDEDGVIYRVCHECNHLFESAEELERANLIRWGATTPAAEIWSCPFCVHDF